MEYPPLTCSWMGIDRDSGTSTTAPGAIVYKSLPVIVDDDEPKYPSIDSIENGKLRSDFSNKSS